MNPKSNQFVSVIIPVWNDSHQLRTCLQALESQTYPKSHYEVIVVDNGSDYPVDNMIKEFTKARTISEVTPGSYAARNKGISVANGEILAFTDSDCVPALDWLENGVNSLSDTPHCGLLAGRVDFFFRNAIRPTTIELLDKFLFLRQREYVERGRFGATANMFTYKTVMDEVGYFDSTLKSSGDYEWGNRVFSAGYKQIYADNVRVGHPARHALNQFCKKGIRVLSGMRELEKRRESSAEPKERKIFFNLGLAVRHILRFLADCVPAQYITRVIRSKEINNTWSKLKIILLLLTTHYVRLCIMMLLKLGVKFNYR
jgi:glycosyltransferase involved in cell wall biosynthesis